MRTLPDEIGNQIRRELDRFGSAGRLGEIVECWPAAVGPAISANAWPGRIARDGTLHVATASSAWAFELTQLAGDVLAKLRERLGDAAPASLRFAVGPLPEPGPPPASALARTAPEPTAEQRRTASEIAAGIQGKSLREAVAKAAAASLAASDGPPADRPV